MNRATTSNVSLRGGAIANLCGTGCATSCGHRLQRGFTLIEIMIVAGIIALIMTVGIPSLVRSVRKEPLRKAASDIVEVCNNARARAIFAGQTTEVVVKAGDRSISVSGGGGERAPSLNASGLSATWSDTLDLEMLDVNFVEYKGADEARARFFPNGMCDELTIILRSQSLEYRKIAFDVMTGQASVDSDPAKWR